MGEGALVIQGDARRLPVRTGSVDVVVTSPPYFLLRSYVDGGTECPGQIGVETDPVAYVSALIEATAEMVRVLKRTGSIWVNLGDKYNGYNANRGDGRIQNNVPRQRVPGGHGLDVPTMRNKTLIGVPWRYALRCMDELGLILRAEVVWSKTNGMPETVTDRCRRSHETWFHFTKHDRYHANRGARYDSVWSYATSTLKVPAELGARHYAVYPTEGPRRIIEGWCPAGGVVLDPFGGAGTTALVAKALGRTGISVDLSGDYGRVARWRVADPGQLTKAGRPA
jgi:DNA modification methylase